MLILQNLLVLILQFIYFMLWDIKKPTSTFLSYNYVLIDQLKITIWLLE